MHIPAWEKVKLVAIAHRYRLGFDPSLDDVLHAAPGFDLKDLSFLFSLAEYLEPYERDHLQNHPDAPRVAEALARVVAEARGWQPDGAKAMISVNHNDVLGRRIPDFLHKSIPWKISAPFGTLHIQNTPDDRVRVADVRGLRPSLVFDIEMSCL